jgi:hypothetical protein
MMEMWVVWRDLKGKGRPLRVGATSDEQQRRRLLQLAQQDSTAAASGRFSSRSPLVLPAEKYILADIHVGQRCPLSSDLSRPNGQ